MQSFPPYSVFDHVSNLVVLYHRIVSTGFHLGELLWVYRADSQLENEPYGAYVKPREGGKPYRDLQIHS